MKNGSLPQIHVVCPHDCPDTCSMVVSVREGRAVDLRGDPEHPFTRGFLCQKVARYLDRVYHPGRLLRPRRRTGPKGSGRFEEITWEEALSRIAERFRALAESPEGPQSILPYSYAGTMGQIQGGSLDRRFFHRLGASLLERTICATAGVAGCTATLGTRAAMDPELVAEARYILNWGSNTAITNSHLWAIMHRARKAGARIVTIDPHRSATASRSDVWIAPRPGTDAALALGMMNIIWREGLQDEDYLERYCLGVEALRERVLKEYAPEMVARITGVSVTEQEQLARDYATIRPAFLRINYGLQRHAGGGMAVRTIMCLPALVGAWRHPAGGALLSTRALYPFATARLERPDLIPRGTRSINMVRLAEALHGELPGPAVRALYVYNANPAAVCPDQARVLSGLRREDLFTVVHDQFQTDTADYADIVLPATTQLEHFDLHGSYGHLYVQTSSQAIEPLGEAKSNTDVFRLLAERMGFEKELFQVSDEQLAREALSETGGFSGIDLERLHKEGSVRLNLPERFAPFAQGGFPTPSGKCEFYCERLAKQGLDPLPTYTPPYEDPQTRPDLAARYPLQLLTPPAAPFLNSTFANVQALRAAAGSPTVEIHAQDATARGIVEGAKVRVFNDRGSFLAVAKLSENVRPGVVVSLGLRWLSHTEDGVNSNVTTSAALTDLGAGATFFDNLVEVALALPVESVTSQ